MRPDLQDLKILAELHKSGKLTAVANTLGLSQPSISIRLAGLRQHFKDQLFVRTSNGMQPTPRAEALIPSIKQALALFNGSLGGDVPFNPATAERTFRISIGSVGQITVLPKVLNRVRALAPSVRIDVGNLGTDTSRLLEMGEADLAIQGHSVEMGPGIYQQTLFDEYFVCMVRSTHPRIKKRISRRQFVDEAHVSPVVPGSSSIMIAKALEDQSIKRRIALTVPSFLGLAQIVSETDLIALVPYHLGANFSKGKLVRILPSPFRLPQYSVKQFWHERYHRDSASIWLRGVIADLFARADAKLQLGQR